MSFQKGFCTVYFGAKEKNTVTLTYSAQKKHTFLGKIMEKSKKNKLPPKEKVAFIITTSKIRTQIHQIIIRWG